MTTENEIPNGDAAAAKLSAPEMSQVWVNFITPFATAIGKSVADTTMALTALVGDPGMDAIELLQNAEYTSDNDIAEAVGAGIPKAKLKKAIAGLRAKVDPAGVESSAAAPVMGTTASLDILPIVPDDSSWLAMLRAGGVLKVDKSTVIAAVRAALGQRVGLYEIPRRLIELMEAFADQNDEPVPPDFYKLRKSITRRSYADVFEAIEGMDGSFVTETRIKQFMDRIEQHLWPVIISFQSQLKSWTEVWQQGATNPAMMMNVFLIMGGGGVGALPPGMMQPPDTGALRDQADAFCNSVNRVFAGTGTQIASALAYDATKIRGTLQNPQLPAFIGAANWDQMLKMLGVAVAPTYPRMEVNLIRYVLAVMNVSGIPSGNDELQYFTALYMLGSQIPWDELSPARQNGKRSTAGIGKYSGDDGDDSQRQNGGGGQRRVL